MRISFYPILILPLPGARLSDLPLESPKMIFNQTTTLLQNRTENRLKIGQINGVLQRYSIRR